MNLDELAKYEIELLDEVVSIEGTMEEKGEQIIELGIYEKYKGIHRQYAKQNKEELESLKRGLFLIWYSASEPSCITGIGELDPNAEEEIIKTLNRRLKSGVTDYELDWMIDYYSTWDFVFERYNDYNEFQKRLKTETKVEMPDKVDREEMKSRGQMGVYWNSLTIFK